MNIDVVKIKNFRNYLGEHEFFLEKTITILYGANGFGKSSFFDAIEWCLTGDISRYGKDFKPKDIINHNCDFEDTECSVEIIFGGNILSRGFKVKNNDVKREAVKVTTESGDIIRYKKNVDNFLKHSYATAEETDLFGDLIKQSHILSQDQVPDFISKDNPKDRFNSLADIMGLKNILYIYENFKGIQSEVDNTKSKLEDERKQNHDNMELRSNDFISMDEKLLEEIERLINYSPSLKVLEEVVPSIEQNRLTLRQEIYQSKELLKEIQGKGFMTVLDAKSSTVTMLSNLRSAEDNLEGLRQLNSRIQTLGESLTQKTDLMKDVIELNNKIEKKSNVLSDFGFSEDAKTIDIVKLIESKRGRLSQLAYALSAKVQYQKLLEEERRSAEVPTLKSKESRMLNRKTRLDFLIKHLLSLLNNSEDGIIVKLLRDIQDIKIYVKQHNHDGKCPVCSAYHGDKLQSKIAGNINFYELLMNEKASKAKRLMDMKKKFEDRTSANDNRLNQTRNEIVELQLLIENALHQLEIIESNALFDDELFNKIQLDEIVIENAQVKNEIKQFDAIITTIEEIKKLEMKRKIKLEELGTKYIGDLSRNAIENRQRRLKRAESRMASYIEKKLSQIGILRNQYNALFALISKIPKGDKEAENQSSIANILTSFEEDEKKIEKDLRLLSKAAELRHAFQFNGKVSSDMADFQTKKENIQKKMNLCDDVLKSTEIFIEHIGGALGTKSKDFLNTSESLIQKYYRYLNPLPSNNIIKFDGDNGKLNILIPFQDDDTQFSNVKHSLSSGQLNVLAIAIFLAINESQKISQLDFVAIDDPIQNMDDVNRFAICDVLGGLKKQLILSTHDLDFVKLFVKKNEHIKSEIQLYMLESPQLKAGKVRRMDF